MSTALGKYKPRRKTRYIRRARRSSGLTLHVPALPKVAAPKWLKKINRKIDEKTPRGVPTWAVKLVLAYLGYRVVKRVFGGASAGGGSFPVLFGQAWDAAQTSAFAAALPSSEVNFFKTKYDKDLATVILAIAKDSGIDPLIVYGVGHIESNWGKQLDADGTGDNGHGHGIFQVDDRTWGPWISANDWQDPYTNGVKGMAILMGTYATVRAAMVGASQAAVEAAAVAGYNTGPANVLKSIKAGLSPDTTTTPYKAAVAAGNDDPESQGYSALVFAAANKIQAALA